MSYVVDWNADEPIMLLNKAVGRDSESQPDGIDGATFQQELMQLDTLGKKRIQVWINSPGGYVMDGYNIFNAILKTKTPVDTYNYGVAGSIAGVIFMAGRRRYMADYAKLMMHNPGGVEDAAVFNSFKDSIATMLSSRANLDKEQINSLMDATTWMGASDCLLHGFCTNIEATTTANRKWSGDPKAYWSECNAVLNSILQPANNNPNPHSTMQKVTNKLGLVSGANEDAIVEAIDHVRNQAAQAIQARDKATQDLAAATNKISDLESQLTEAKNKLQEHADRVAAAEKAALTEKATNLVKAEAQAGRIKNDDATITAWTNKAVEDFDGTKALLESLPTNKKAPEAVDPSQFAKDDPRPDASSAVNLMAQVINKTKAKAH